MSTIEIIHYYCSISFHSLNVSQHSVLHLLWWWGQQYKSITFSILSWRFSSTCPFSLPISFPWGMVQGKITTYDWFFFFQLYFGNMYFNRQMFSCGHPSFKNFPFDVHTRNTCCIKFGSHYSQSPNWQFNTFSGFYMDMLYPISFSLPALEIEVKSIT